MNDNLNKVRTPTIQCTSPMYYYHQKIIIQYFMVFIYFLMELEICGHYCFTERAVDFFLYF